MRIDTSGHSRNTHVGRWFPCGRPAPFTGIGMTQESVLTPSDHDLRFRQNDRARVLPTGLSAPAAWLRPRGSRWGIPTSPPLRAENASNPMKRAQKQKRRYALLLQKAGGSRPQRRQVVHLQNAELRIVCVFSLWPKPSGMPATIGWLQIRRRLAQNHRDIARIATNGERRP